MLNLPVFRIPTHNILIAALDALGISGPVHEVVTKFMGEGVVNSAPRRLIPRLIEDSGEIPCVFRFGGFCLTHDSWRIPHRRRSRQARRVGARWLGSVAGDAAGQRLGAVGRWMELSGSRRCVVDGRRHDPWLAQTV